MYAPDLSSEREEWRDDALCAQTAPELFHPDKGGSAREAKQICAQCSVIDECLNYALKHGEEQGIWGGLSPSERRHLEASRELSDSGRAES